MLKISALTLGYSNKTVLDFKGIELEKGGQCLISGASGSGKTTLLYAIAGLIKPQKGNITLNGTDISALNESNRDHFRGKNIGIIFQTLHLIKHLSVIDNLLLSSYVAGHKQDKKQAQQVLATLGIENKKDVFPEQLSQGQAQRVAIARAIMHKPSLLLADEPTSSLDDVSCSAVISLLKQAAKDTGAMLLISTHDSRVREHFKNIVKLGA